MALRGGPPNAAAAGAAAGAAVAAGAAAAQQFWASALAAATGAATMQEGTTVVQPFASGGYTWRIEARFSPSSVPCWFLLPPWVLTWRTFSPGAGVDAGAAALVRARQGAGEPPVRGGARAPLFASLSASGFVR